MKTVVYDKLSDLIDDVLKTIDDKDNLSIFCDYELAFEILQSIDLTVFENTLIELDSEVDEYYIGKVGTNFFGIEKARCESGNYNGKLKLVEADYILIFTDAVERFDEVTEALYPFKDMWVIDYDDYDLYDDDFIVED